MRRRVFSASLAAVTEDVVLVAVCALGAGASSVKKYAIQFVGQAGGEVPPC